MEKIDWQHTFKLNILMLKLTGVWPPGEGTYESNLYTVYASISFILFHFGFIFFQTVNLYFIRDDLQAVTGTIFILITDIGASLKTYGLVKNMKMLKQMMITTNCDLFQPKNLHQKDIIQPGIQTWRIIVLTFGVFCSGWLILCSLFPILDKSSKDYRLPFLAWYPYNTKTSPQYELTYLYQAVAINFLAVVNVSIDSLIAALNMYVGAQFDILCDDLRNLHSQETSAEVNQKLINCVHHHREILKFAEYASNFYNWLLFVQFFVGGISIGLTMFQLTVVVPLSSQFHALVCFATCITVQVFLYCWFGNEIEIKSSKLPYAIFECDWTDLSPEVKKNMLFFGMRLQKSLQVSAFGLFYLSLETFVKILRTAYSYFALLRQVNKPAE
ncbi:7tm 6 domain containing protein [Asbolus verrucosus]|uniref:Odorant receptor n=1 Tax=Asbolus verrucosus TaxID=1661398 RepID=A0A482VVU6_ASBVE|nr:7tm 6 domain containing protein [Asbolus verrucosus]